MVDNVLPPQGTPGIFDPRNPTLLPNFDTPEVPAASATDPGGTGAGVLSLRSAADFLTDFPRVEATATATIAGSVTTGDIVTIEASSPVFPGGLISESYTVQAGDTVDKIADSLQALFDDNPVAAAVGLRADVLAGVITFRQAGPVGNFTVLSAPTLEKSTITIAGTALTGDQITALFTGPALPGGFVAIQQAVTTGQSVTTIAGNIVAAINANAALIAAGITATNTAGVITLTVPATVEPIVVSAFVNSNPLTATIGGSITTNDTVSLIFTGAGIAGSPVTVTYTVLGTDTTTTIAAALVALIAANAALQSAGITASNVAAVITVAFNLGNVGQVRLTSSVTGAATETVTITATPTDTATVGTAATETVTFAPSNGAMSGGSGPIFAANNFEFAFPGTAQVQAFFYGKPYNLGYDVITQMVQQGMPIL